MEWYTILLLVTGALLGLMLLGVPILFGLGAIDVALVVLLWGERGYSLFGSVPFGEIDNFVLLAVPLFILVGELVVHSRINRDFFEMANAWLGWLPGGLAVTTQIMSTIFAAISGASTANTVIIGSVAADELLKRGYDKRLTAGCIVAGGSLGMLIPPSTMMILYGVLNQVSIGHLFMGGVMPGLVISALFIAYILYVAIRTPERALPATGITWSLRWRTLWKVWAVLLLVLVMLGCIYSGLATPTEVGGLGAFTAMGIAAVYRRLNWRILRGALLNTVRTTGFILWVLVAALLFGRVLTALGVTQALTEHVAGLPLPPWGILLLVNGLLLVLGALMDPAAIVAVTSPILVPIMTQLGYDPLWFGIVFMVNMELAFLTPPFGLNLFILKSIAPPQMGMDDIIMGALPFMALLLVGLGLVMVFPGLATWLPATMR